MPRIVIGTEVIDFPNSGRDALWSPSVIQFAEAVADQLGIISGISYIPNTVITIPNSIDDLELIDNIQSGIVRKFVISYGIYIEYDVVSSLDKETVAVSGTLQGVYDTFNGTWELQNEFTGTRKDDGTSFFEFSMSGDSLIFNLTSTLTAPYNTIDSRITFSGKTELVDL